MIFDKKKKKRNDPGWSPLPPHPQRTEAKLQSLPQFLAQGLTKILKIMCQWINLRGGVGGGHILIRVMFYLFSPFLISISRHISKIVCTYMVSFPQRYFSKLKINLLGESSKQAIILNQYLGRKKGFLSHYQQGFMFLNILYTGPLKTREVFEELHLAA